MSRSFGGPKLPSSLLEKVQGGRISKSGRNANATSRKDARKTERLNRKRGPSKPQPPRRYIDDEQDAPPPKSKPVPPKKSAPKQPQTRKLPSPQSGEEAPARKPLVSKAVKAKLENDDAEIAALEKRLGLKKKKKSRTGDDELDWLVYGSESDEEGMGKRKHPEDNDWLQNKRRKAVGTEIVDRRRDAESESEDAEDKDLEDLADPFSDDEVSGDDHEEETDGFEGFEVDGDVFGAESEDEPAEATAVKHRENPYVAPVIPAATVKYVPPSLRKAAESDEELLKQLRRQLQGLLNRLSESNLVSILNSVQEVYTKNARQHVTSTLIDLLRSLISDPAALNDTFLILHAGFGTALYRVLGTDFGAQLLESIVQAFDELHRSETEGKQTVNLISFLSDLYIMNATGCEIIFDYIKILLDKENFSEANTELLLRIIRRAGTQLRKDDPTSLKDIVLLLQRTISHVGESNVSVRTKFMIETIHDLKNNRMKTGVVASNVFAEHMQHMKKTLGSLKSTKTTEPMRITLSDIRDSEKKGKWWLVGASYRDPAKMASSAANPNAAEQETAAPEEDGVSDADSDSPNLDKIAREQGMNTDVRRAIFISVAGAVDFQHAYLRIQKLNLKNKQRLEIPRVLLHCVGAESEYNHYYSLVATRFCGDHKLRKAWQFALLDLFRRLGEDSSGEQEDENDSANLEVRQVYNSAKLYATLTGEGLLRVNLLKSLDLSDMQPKTSVFAQVFLTTVFILLRKKAHRDGYENAVKEAYLHVHAVPEMIPGLKFYLSTIIATAELAQNKKEKKVIQNGCDYALEALSAAPQRLIAVEDDMDDSD